MWVPTIELTTHFWERPPKRDAATSSIPSLSPYLRLRFYVKFVRRGLFMCDSEVWSEDGTALYSSSRQLARVLVPR